MSKLCNHIDSVIDNRGKNPDKYYSIEKYPVIDNYLIKNTIYPIMSDVKRYIDQEEYDNFLRCYIRKDEVLMTLVGNGYGNVTLAPSDNVAIIQNTIGFRTKNNLSNIFLFYYLQYINKSIKALDRGSSQPSLKVSDILDLNVNIPEIKKQILISNTLQTIDLKIENNNKIISTLEHLAKTIYDYWFLQFEFPNEDGKPYKSSGGKMVWNDELKREIPEGWKVRSLFDCMDVAYGYPLLTDRFTEKEGTPVIRIRDILDNTTSAYTTEIVDDKFLSKPKDLLVGMDGNFHMNFCHLDNCYINQRIVRIRDKKHISAMQVYFEIYPFIKHKEQRVARSTVGHLSDKDLKSILILDSMNEQIYNTFNCLLEKLCLLRQESQKLASLRDFLLPMLMNGQVTFKEEA